MDPGAASAAPGDGPLLAGDELLLRDGDVQLVVSPYGAGLRRAWVQRDGARRDLVWGYAGREGKRGGQGDVLMPWPGRIAGGTYDFAGRRLRLPHNDKAGPNAIHGLVRTRTWETEAERLSAASFVLRLRRGDEPGYPFDLLLRIHYEARDGGIACRFEAQNVGEEDCPFGAGFHPYLVPASGLEQARLQVPAAGWVEREGVLPTGGVRPASGALDLRTMRSVGGARLDDCFTGLSRDGDGLARVRLDDVELWMDAAFGFVQVFTGDTLGPSARQALAVEPMTCAPGAFVHPGLGLRVLAPGERMRGSWGIRLAADG
jgi:aldose 1-epimerase